MLFSCSIRDNISYGAVDPDAVSTEDVYRAARVANAYNFIQAFPKGFDTVVGEKGVLLSGETSHRTFTHSKNRFLPALTPFAGTAFPLLLCSFSVYSLKIKEKLSCLQMPAFVTCVLFCRRPEAEDSHSQGTAQGEHLCSENSSVGYRLLTFTLSFGELLFSSAFFPTES